jgi:hypothetical protein
MSDIAAKTMEALTEIQWFCHHAKVDKKTMETAKKAGLVNSDEKSLTEDGKELVEAWFAKGSNRGKLLEALRDYLK